MNFLSFLIARLKEPSTYAGLGLIAGAVGLQLSGVQIDAITDAGIAIAGAASVFLPEKSVTPEG
jgi:hypothetical protein